MRCIVTSILAVFLIVAVASNVWAVQQTFILAPGDSLHVTCTTSLTGAVGADTADLVCATLVPTASPTHTHTPTPSAANGYHAPGAHDGLNVHEHGDAPPAWVLASSQQPFTQTRESHTGYKGVLARDVGGKGVESYFITHILSTSMARSHGDHDYQLWVKRTDGTVLTSQGRLDFSGNPRDITAPIPLKKVDDGTRPIALGERGPGDVCETWYSRPGANVFDMEWTICGRYQAFDGTILGGIGAVRTMGWVIYKDRLPVGDSLRDNCTVEFTVCRHSWHVDTKSYQAPGIAPIN